MKRRLIAIIMAVSVAMGLSACGEEKKTASVPDIMQVRTICNLATLECEYNNVAKYDKPKTGLKGESKIWIEYKGWVKLGIDVNDVSLSVQDTTVNVSVPAAKVLDIGIVENTLTDSAITISKKGIFKQEITTDEKTEAIKSAQNEMREEATNNTLLLARAQNRAILLIENYIKQLGEANGTEYVINWDIASDN